MPAEQSLPEMYREHVERCIDENGISIAQAFVIGLDGAMTLMALDLSTTQIYHVALREWSKGQKEMIFALDRFAKEGQGTTLGDLLAGHYFVAGQSPRHFIIEYQNDPRIVQPIAWDNAFWNAALARELASAKFQI